MAPASLHCRAKPMATLLRTLAVCLLSGWYETVRASESCCDAVCTLAQNEQACEDAVPNEACEPSEFYCLCQWTVGNTSHDDQGVEVGKDLNSTNVEFCVNTIVPNATNEGDFSTVVLVSMFFGIAAFCGGICTCIYCFCVKKEPPQKDVAPIIIRTDPDGNAVIGDDKEIDYRNKKYDVRARDRTSLDDIRLPSAMSAEDASHLLRSRSSTAGSRAGMLRHAASMNGSVASGSATPLSASRSQAASFRPGSFPRSTSSVRSMGSAERSVALSMTPSRHSAPMSGFGIGRTPTAGMMDQMDESTARVFLQPQLDPSALMFDLKHEARCEAEPEKTEADFRKEDLDKEGKVAASKMGMTRVKSWSGSVTLKSGRVKEAAQQIDAQQAAAEKQRQQLVKQHAMEVLGVQRETTEDLLATPGRFAAREILRQQSHSFIGPRHRQLLGPPSEAVDTQMEYGRTGQGITHERLNHADEVFTKMNRAALLPVPTNPTTVRRKLPSGPRVDGKVGYSHGDPGLPHLKIRTVGAPGGVEGQPEPAGEEEPGMARSAKRMREAATKGGSWREAAGEGGESGGDGGGGQELAVLGEGGTAGSSEEAEVEAHDVDAAGMNIFRPRASRASLVSDVGSLEGPDFAEGVDSGARGLQYEKPDPPRRREGSFKGIRGSFSSSFKNTLALAGLAGDQKEGGSRRGSKVSRQNSFSSQHSGKFQNLGPGDADL